MKRYLKKNVITMLLVGSMISTPVYSVNLNLDKMVNHWAKPSVDMIIEKFEVDSIFKNKDLNEYIKKADFDNIVKLTFEKQYQGSSEIITREVIVNEFVEIWAQKTGKNANMIPMTEMIIYPDTQKISPDYLKNINIAHKYNIAKGRETGFFDPKSNVTFGELASLVSNTLNGIEKEGNIKPQPIAKGNYETKAMYVITDDEVKFYFELMSHYTQMQSINFGSGQQFEITITNDRNEEVYRFSDGKNFTMALINKTLSPGESIKWQESWNMTDKNGQKVAKGNYKANFKILAMTHEKNNIQDKELTMTIDLILS